MRYWPPTTFLSRQQRISSGLSFQLFANFLFSRSIFQHRVWILTQHYHFIFRAKFYLCNSFKCFPRFGRFLGQKVLFCAFVDEIPFPALFLSLMRPFHQNCRERNQGTREMSEKIKPLVESSSSLEIKTSLKVVLEK